MLRSTSAGARSILNRAKRPMAVAALMGSVGFAGASATTTAMAHPASGTLITCDPFGSGDRCFFNDIDAHTLDNMRTNTQYGRDQVCAKARLNNVNGPVAEPDRSGCAPNTDYISVQYDGTQVPKYGYGYWSGNGGGIWVRVRADY